MLWVIGGGGRLSGCICISSSRYSSMSAVSLFVRSQAPKRNYTCSCSGISYPNKRNVVEFPWEHLMHCFLYGVFALWLIFCFLLPHSIRFGSSSIFSFYEKSAASSSCFVPFCSTRYFILFAYYTIVLHVLDKFLVWSNVCWNTQTYVHAKLEKNTTYSKIDDVHMTVYLVLPIANRPIYNRCRAHNESGYFLQPQRSQVKTCSTRQCLHCFLWLCVFDLHQLFSFLNLIAMKIPTTTLPLWVCVSHPHKTL